MIFVQNYPNHKFWISVRYYDRGYNTNSMLRSFRLMIKAAS